MRLPLCVLLIGVAGVVPGGVILAQTPANLQPVGQPAITPTVSPYINLLRPGATPAINYFGDVLPQQTYNNTLPYLQGQIGAGQQALNQVQYGVGALETGHTTRFMNYGGYFNNINGGVGGRGASFAPGFRTTPTQGLPGQGFNGALGAYGAGYGGSPYGVSPYGGSPYGGYGPATGGYYGGYGR